MPMSRLACIASVILFFSFTTRAETPQEALASLSASNQKWVNESCSRSLGPSLWSSCVRREVDALRLGVPDISNLSSENQSWIRSSCSRSLGPNLTISCMHREIAAIEAGLPDLSILTREQRVWLDESCSRALGPSLYRSCVNREWAVLAPTKASPPLQAPSKGEVTLTATSKPPPNEAMERSGSDMSTEDLFTFAALIVILFFYLLPILWVLFSGRSHGGAKFGWFIVAAVFSWIGLAVFLILTQASNDRKSID